MLTQLHLTCQFDTVDYMTQKIFCFGKLHKNIFIIHFPTGVASRWQCSITLKSSHKFRGFLSDIIEFVKMTYLMCDFCHLQLCKVWNYILRDHSEYASSQWRMAYFNSTLFLIGWPHTQNNPCMSSISAKCHLPMHIAICKGPLTNASGKRLLQNFTCRVHMCWFPFTTCFAICITSSQLITYFVFFTKADQYLFVWF